MSSRLRDEPNGLRGDDSEALVVQNQDDPENTGAGVDQRVRTHRLSPSVGLGLVHLEQRIKYGAVLFGLRIHRLQLRVQLRNRIGKLGLVSVWGKHGFLSEGSHYRPCFPCDLACLIGHLERNL